MSKNVNDLPGGVFRFSHMLKMCIFLKKCMTLSRTNTHWRVSHRTVECSGDNIAFSCRLHYNDKNLILKRDTEAHAQQKEQTTVSHLLSDRAFLHRQRYLAGVTNNTSISAMASGSGPQAGFSSEFKQSNGGERSQRSPL